MADSERRYSSMDDYNSEASTKREAADYWRRRLEAADKVKKAWLNRFRNNILYQYYEGFQWLEEPDENNRPYIVNMIYSVLENKLPGLIYQNPKFEVKPRPTGIHFDLAQEIGPAQIKEDVLNYLCAERKYGIADKHELAVLDAFFGFGVLEAGCSSDPVMNPYMVKKGGDPYYCKQIPFDQFIVAAHANWDLSMGKWYGYYEFVPWDRLKKYKSKIDFTNKSYSGMEAEQLVDNNSGTISVNADIDTIIAPTGHCLVWKLWDFETSKFTLFCPDHCEQEDSILEYKDFRYSPISTLRFGKRRKGWYPLPPVFNWINPQDEVNDIRQAQRIHRKRFKRKYQVLESSVDQPELDKFLYGPDGTVFTVKRPDAIKAVEDPTMDPSNLASLVSSYDDLHRVSGTAIEERNVGDRTTATQTMVLNKKSQVRESKDILRVTNFLCDFARSSLKALRELGGKPIWYRAQMKNQSLIGTIQDQFEEWKNTTGLIFDQGDEDVTINASSISPVADQTEKTAFMEFMALITQYEILAFSPDLLLEAAYRVGYKNMRVIGQLQQWAQMAAIGRQMQLQKLVGGSMGPQPTEPGKMAQEQVSASQSPFMEQITNAIFNRQPVQSGTQE